MDTDFLMDQPDDGNEQNAEGFQSIMNLWAIQSDLDMDTCTSISKITVLKHMTVKTIMCLINFLITDTLKSDSHFPKKFELFA